MTNGIEIVPELPDTRISQRPSTGRFTSTRLMWPVLGRDAKSFWHLAIALAVWITGTFAAVVWARIRHLQIR